MKVNEKVEQFLVILVMAVLMTIPILFFHGCYKYSDGVPLTCTGAVINMTDAGCFFGGTETVEESIGVCETVYMHLSDAGCSTEAFRWLECIEVFQEGDPCSMCNDEIHEAYDCLEENA